MTGTLVLKKFNVNPDAKEEPLVEIAGRVSGAISFLLTMIGVDPTTHLKCFHDRIEFREASLFGEQNMTIPLPATSGITGGYTKPFKLLAISGVVFVGSFVLAASAGTVAFLTGMAISAGFLVTYVLKKEMGVHVQNGGDKLWGLNFKRSVIENMPVDIDRVKQAVQLINAAVLRAHSA